MSDPTKVAEVDVSESIYGSISVAETLYGDITISGNIYENISISEFFYESISADQLTNDNPSMHRPVVRAQDSRWIPDGLNRPSPIGAKPGRPLRVIHVSVAMIPAGIDKWLTGLIRHSDPRLIQFVRCIVTSDLVDLKQLARVGIPVEVGGRESIRRASQDCDILLISDPGDDFDWLEEARAELCVFVAHGDGHWTRRRMERLRPAIDHVIAVSNRVLETVCEGFPSTLIPNGVDPVHLTRSRPLLEVRASLGFRQSDFVLGFVGRFSPEKNPFAVIEALEGLPSHFKALMVGFGPLRSQLIDLANQKIPGRFAFAVGEEHLGDYYGAMDAFCMASHTEGYGLAIMEAMMCGKPPIVSRVGFVQDGIIDRVNGLVVIGDPSSIREAVTLLESHRDWAQGVAREAQAYADRHGHASSMANRYAQVLRALWSQKDQAEKRVVTPSTNGLNGSIHALH